MRTSSSCRRSLRSNGCSCEGARCRYPDDRWRAVALPVQIEGCGPEDRHVLDLALRDLQPLERVWIGVRLEPLAHPPLEQREGAADRSAEHDQLRVVGIEGDQDGVAELESEFVVEPQGLRIPLTSPAED